MTTIYISSTLQLTPAQTFESNLAAFEAGGAPLPDPAVIQGEDADEQPVQVMFVAPGYHISNPNVPSATTVVFITTSRDLDEVDPMAERMEAFDESTQAHVGDVVIAVKPGALAPAEGSN